MINILYVDERIADILCRNKKSSIKDLYSLNWEYTDKIIYLNSSLESSIVEEIKLISPELIIIN